MAPIASSDEFYVGTRASVLRQLTAMTTDPELAADVVQEAYSRARWRGDWRSVSTDDSSSRARTAHPTPSLSCSRTSPTSRTGYPSGS
jgi:hypothetical protein